MPRNGRFADDGRVSDFAARVKTLFTNINNRVDVVLNTATEALEKGNNNNTLITGHTSVLGGMQESLANMELLLASKANQASITALQTLWNERYNNEDIESLIQVAKELANQAVTIANNAVLATSPSFGKLAKTDLFQNIGGGGHQNITMSPDQAQGNIEHDPSIGGGALVLIKEGSYLVTVNGYYTGGSNWMGTTSAQIYYDGQMGNSMGSAMAWKPNQQDYTITRSETAWFPANTAICVRAMGIRSDGTPDPNAATWGDQNRVGCTMSVIKL